MVKKLIKYEFFAYLQTLLPMQLIMIGIAVLCRFIQLFESDDISYNIVFVSSVVAVVISVLVSFVMTMVYGITRFYKNLFTSEGYLSFTLPVTPSQHIVSKLLMLIIATFITLFSVLVTVAIATAGDVFVELVKVVNYLLNSLCEEFGVVNIIFIAIEIFLIFVIGLISQYLLCYGCISIGQLANKNRVLAAFGVYFGYYLFTQLIGTIFVVITTALVNNFDFYIVTDFVNTYPKTSMHLFLTFFIVFYAVLSFVYYLVTKKVITNRLNLE